MVAVEVERCNDDIRTAVPDDYDKMAACDPEAAIWVVPTHADGHTVLQALNDPLEGPFRIEKEYSESMRVSRFRIDQPGFTEMRTIEQLQRDVLG